MKTNLAFVAALLIAGLASCDNGAGTTANTTTDTMHTAAPAADPNMVTTTTTTTTTRPVFQPRPQAQYVDLRTRKVITVRVDTVHHYVVNAQTNQPVDFFMEQGSTDTFYGRNMQRANGYIDYSSGTDWKYDESRTNMNSGSSSNGGMDNANSGSNMSGSSTTSGSSSATDNGSMNGSTGTGTGTEGARKVKIKETDDKTKIKVKH